MVKNGQPGRPKKTFKRGVHVRIKNKGSQAHKKGPKRPTYQSPWAEHPETTRTIWHTYWSYAERWRTCGAVHERTLRHDWHECLTLQSYELFQGVPPTDSDRWVAWVLFYALVI